MLTWHPDTCKCYIKIEHLGEDKFNFIILEACEAHKNSTGQEVHEENKARIIRNDSHFGIKK